MPRLGRCCLWISSSLAMVALCSLASAQVSLEILPASPRYQEPVYARITPGRMSGFHLYGAKVAMTGNAITIEPEMIIDIGSGPAFDVLLGRFPAGSYEVQVQIPWGGPASARFTVGPRMPQTPGPMWPSGSVPAVDYSGMWWNERESGWGLSVSQGPTNQLFAVWFVYDAAGAPTWFTLESGQWMVSWGETRYTGWLYKYTGPPFAIAFDPNRIVGTLVGTGVLTFRDAFTGRLDYAMVGASGYKEITRLPIE